MNLATGCLYFIKDQYFIDFPDDKLIRNKETVNGQPHNRPCFVALREQDSDIVWFIPFSSQTTKYHAIANKKIQQYGKCDTILFGYVLGHEKAFLIQNMFPATDRYVLNQYIDSYTNNPVRLDGAFETKLIQSAKKVLALVRQGRKLIFADVLKIESKLKNNGL